MTHRAKASHIGGGFSCADLLSHLYSGILNVRPDEPAWAERDRFIMSKGHCCAVLYAALALRGFFPKAELEEFGKDGARLMAHVSHKVPGVDFSTGSLGHGLGFGCGKALAAKRRGKDWRTFVMLSDGELDEGSNWEAILFAQQHRLDNLIAVVDYNKIQSLGSVNEVISLDSLSEKFQAFNWAVREINGHDHDQIEDALCSVPWEPGQPSCIIAHTVKGKGVSFMENTLAWHYKTVDTQQLGQAQNEIKYL
jgi:transketolase